MKKSLLIKESIAQKDLFMINVQPVMKNRIHFDIEEFSKWVKYNGGEFKHVFYFYNGETSNPESMLELKKWIADDIQLSGKYFTQDISELKNYFDGILDSNYTDEEIIIVGKYMISQNYDTITNTIIPDEIDQLEISDEFKEDIKNGKFKLKIPHNLVVLFKDVRNPYLVGGLNHSSLRMFRLLLGMTNTDYTQSQKWLF